MTGDTRAPRTRRPAHPHRRQRRHGDGRGDPRPRRAPDRPRRHRHHRPRADRRRGRRPCHGRDRGLRAEVIVGEEVTTLGGHLLALFLDRPIRPYRSLRATIAAVHDAGGLAIPAHPLVPYPLCAQGWVLRRLLDDPDEAVRPDAIETFNPTTLGKPWHARVTRFADDHGLAHVGNSDAHALAAIGTGWTTFPGRDAGGPAPGHRDADDRTRRRLPPDGRAARHVRAADAKAQPRRTRRAPWPDPARRHRPRPRLPGRPPPATTLRTRGGWPIVKIGLVCPYIYPESGGVAQHVRFLYENLRLRGHDVRIITASHGPQRASEGDILRIGVGFSMPTNGSVGTLTFSPRYLGQVRELLARERFDLLHFHEPFVPFLSLFLLRESRSVNVATFHAYAGFSPVVRARQPGHARPCHRGFTAGSRSARRRATSSTASSRATTRSSPTASTSRGSPRRSPSPAGRTACPTSCSSAGSSPARACSTCSRRTASCARPGPATAC